MKPYKILLSVVLLIGISLLRAETASAQTYTLSPNGYICGPTATFTLSGSQAGVSYQLNDGSNVGNPVIGTGSALTWSNVTIPNNGSEFFVYASNNGGSPTMVAYTEILVIATVTGTVSPNTTQTLCPGGSVTFTVTVPPVSGQQTYAYQWFNQSMPLTGQTGTTLTVTTPGTYAVLINGACYHAEITCPAVVAGVAPLAPGAFLTPQTVVQKGTTQTTYTITASGTPGVTYNWAISPAAGTISGSGTSATVTWNTTYTGAATISCAAVNGCGSTAATPLTVNVLLPVNGGSIGPADQQANMNVAPSQQLINIVSPSGGNGSFTYMWQTSTNGTTWSAPVSGGQSLIPGPAAVTTYYRRMATSGGLTGYSNVVAVIISGCLLLNTNVSYASTNYIMTTTPRVSGLTSTASLQGLTTCSLMQAIQYLDGLGRPIQTIQVKASPGFNDLVQPIAYDNMGRQSIKYLAYSSAVNDGSYKPNATSSDLTAFYSPVAPTPGVCANPVPYAVTGFEKSSLNRVIEQGAPGVAWQINGAANSANTDNTAKITYTTNDQTSTFSSTYTPGTPNNGSKIVALYTVSNNALVRLNNNATYSPGKLYVTVHRDENWNPATDGCIGTTEEYKDLNGHVILKRSYNLQVAGTTSTVQMLSTYYVYDIYGNLCFVLPPGANPDANTAILQTTLNSLCYQYQYDWRNRLAAKRLPGKLGWENTVYNSIDQPVATQDPNQAAQNEWIIMKYDAQGREIMTGLWNNGTTYTQAALQTLVNGQSTLWESTAGTGNGYTNNAWPTTSVTQVLTVNYYDSYSSIPSGLLPGKFIAPTGAITNAAGLPVATQTNILGGANMLWGAQYYDNLGRLITGYKQHFFGGTVSVNNYDQVTTTYNFNNQATTTTRKHFNTGNPGNVIVTIANRYIYDQAGRKTNTWQQITNGTSASDTRTLVAQDVYNETGQLLVKNLHNTTDSVNFYQNVQYRYNERGWLLSDSTLKPMFTEQLQYNNNWLNLSGYTVQYNGNMTGQTRTTAATYAPAVISYSFSYDRLNRLISGQSTDNNNETGLQYDLMGNIKALIRSGYENDNLTYNYLNGGLSNQVSTIANVAGANSGLANGTNTYNSYDPNGNLTYDARNATGISYNLRNLPLSITAKNITYTYDASGQKLRVVNGTTSTTTEYLGGIEYDYTTGTAPVLTFIQTEEGQAIPNTSTTYNYEYNLADHLGNMRIMFDTKSGSAAVVQQDDYYPFGTDITRVRRTTKNRYLYNKKELEDVTSDYDYGARFYDPVIARWKTGDPLSEVSWGASPYIYGENNPVTTIDPSGMLSMDIGGGGSPGLSSMDVGTGGEVEKITDDGDPGVYKKIFGQRTLIGFMDPDKQYKIGDKYTYYGQPDYYLKHPLLIAPATFSLFSPNFSNQGGGENNGNESKAGDLAQTITLATGTGADAARLYTEAHAGAVIYYTNINGVLHWVATSEVLNVMEKVGKISVIGGILVDGVLYVTGHQSGAKTAANITVAIVAFAVGGPAGIVIGIGYYALDKLGVFELRKGTYYREPGAALIDNLRYVPANLSHH